MGEAAVSGDCREEMDLDVREGEVRAEAMAVKKVENGLATVVRWERPLPRMVLRVLLVESDDSTRQIIAALLRKCSYKVAAVGDGLKAWELLKGKHQYIDLILTEVDLPSISGFALLTLIMEHDICKHTPVIMMSSNDSVSMVYKCMLRGAADFLVKPVRINELRNVWQHVWRRQASARNGPQDDSSAQQKVEVTAENNTVSTPSSGYVACVQRNKECIEKGSDAQSSCTKPDVEMEAGSAEDTYVPSQPKKIKSPEIEMNMHKADECFKSSRKMLVQDNEGSGMVVARGEDVDAMTQEKNLATAGEGEHANVLSEAHSNIDVSVNASREAIDFIGTFNDYPNSNFRNSSLPNGDKKFDSSPVLDLSLRRFHPSGSVNQVGEDRHALNHSDASAFSRYVNRAPKLQHSTPSITNQQRDFGDRHFSDHTFNCYSDTHSISSQKNVPSSAAVQARQAGVTFPSCEQSVISIPIPVRGVRLDCLSPTYGSAVSPLACKQTEASPVQSPGSACLPSNLETRNSSQVFSLMDQNHINSTKEAGNFQNRKLDSSEDHRHFSSATDQSASSSFCQGTAGQFNSADCGNNVGVDQTAAGSSVVENGSSVGPIVFDKNYERSIHREAALTKFRLKRKERCFEKKVRYESRKKLAEQRPRIKGQFVRQLPASVKTDSQCGDSVEG